MLNATAQRTPLAKLFKYKTRLKVGRHVQDEPDPENPGSLIEVNHFQGEVFYSRSNLAKRWPEKYERADDYQQLTGNDEADLDSLYRLRADLDARIDSLRTGNPVGLPAGDKPLFTNTATGTVEELEREILRSEELAENPVKAQLRAQGGVQRVAKMSDSSGDMGGNPAEPLRLDQQPSNKPGGVPVNAKPMAADPKAKLEALEKLNPNDLKRLCQNNLGPDNKPAPIAVPANATKAQLIELLVKQ